MRNILIVDDEEQIVSVLKEFLILRGYNVFTSPDGPTALSKINEVKPQVVLLDIIMPGMNGIDTLIKIKEIDQDIVVVMMSALSERDLIRKAIMMGAHDYVIKPFDLDYIDTVIMTKIGGFSSNLDPKIVSKVF
jgi:DNA-binding response OmpR family regulator